MGPLVSTEWLAAELGQPNLLVFDTTKFLPNEAGDGRTEYLKAHIPGARFWDSDLVSDPESDLPTMVSTAAQFAARAGELGIGPGTRVVFYDQKGLSTAARGWWLLGLFGFDNAAVLDGGFPKWTAENRPVDSGEVAAATPKTFTPALRATRLRGVGDVIANLASGDELILDARTAARFAGTSPEPRKGLRAGHIPGSRSLPYGDLLGPDFTFKDAAALRERFAKAGVDGSRPVVTSCGSGVSAAILTLGLKLAGLPQGAIYDGSWTEWGSREDTDIATGAE